MTKGELLDLLDLVDDEDEVLICDDEDKLYTIEDEGVRAGTHVLYVKPHEGESK